MNEMPPRIESSLVNENGRWQIAPHGPVRATRRRYRGNTPILETDFDTAEGSIRLVDFIPPLCTAPVVVRLVEGVRGCVRVRMDLRVPRDNAGSIWLRTPVDTREVGCGVRADFFVTAGELVPFVLSRQPAQEAAPAAIDPFRALADTESYWAEWARSNSHSAEWREGVAGSTYAAAARSCSRGRMA
jgi:hypothetical protein